MATGPSFCKSVIVVLPPFVFGPPSTLYCRLLEELYLAMQCFLMHAFVAHIKTSEVSFLMQNLFASHQSPVVVFCLLNNLSLTSSSSFVNQTFPDAATNCCHICIQCYCCALLFVTDECEYDDCFYVICEMWWTCCIQCMVYLIFCELLYNDDDSTTSTVLFICSYLLPV